MPNQWNHVIFFWLEAIRCSWQKSTVYPFLDSQKVPDTLFLPIDIEKLSKFLLKIFSKLQNICNSKSKILFHETGGSSTPNLLIFWFFWHAEISGHIWANLPTNEIFLVFFGIWWVLKLLYIAKYYFILQIIQDGFKLVSKL